MCNLIKQIIYLFFYHFEINYIILLIQNTRECNG